MLGTVIVVGNAGERIKMAPDPYLFFEIHECVLIFELFHDERPSRAVRPAI
jgi:hypothetical protein